MGYRTYIAPMTKKEHSKIKGMTLAELYKHKGLDLENDMDYLGVYDIPQKAIHEFGKYTEFDEKKFFTKVFENKETNKHFTEEHDFWIVGKEYLEHIITFYKDKTTAYYNNMVNPFFSEKYKPSEFLNTVKNDYSGGKSSYTFDFSKITPEEQTALFNILEHMKSMRSEWAFLTPFNLEIGEEVTTSWKFEYTIFDLVRIYKAFDWKNNLLIYYGY